MKTLTQTYTINAPIEKVWRALVDPQVIDAWGGGPARMSDEVGAPFSLWGGDIFGKNTEVRPNTSLVQEWSDTDFKEPSEVRFELTGKSGTTILRLTQTNLADGRFRDIDEGWRDYYLGPLKAYLER